MFVEHSLFMEEYIDANNLEEVVGTGPMYNDVKRLDSDPLDFLRYSTNRFPKIIAIFYDLRV